MNGWAVQRGRGVVGNRKRVVCGVVKGCGAFPVMVYKKVGGHVAKFADFVILCYV